MAFANPGFVPRLRTYQALSLLLASLSLAWSAGAQIVLSDYTTNSPLKVMAIGDSITDDCSYNGAWRFYLQPLLQSSGYAFTFVGRQSSIPSRTFTEKRHEGYCGAVIAPPGMMPDPVHGYAGTNVYLLRTIADALTNMTPDVVLVVMGANDIGRGRNPFYVATNDMPHLLDLIFSNAPVANIVLTKTTTLSNAIIGYATNASNVPVYNAALQALVNQRAASGQRISLADMFSVVDYSTMFNGDHLHPNPVDLKSMANEFLTRIELLTVRSNPVMATLVPAGAIWRYSDKGQDLGTIGLCRSTTIRLGIVDPRVWATATRSRQQQFSTAQTRIRRIRPLIFGTRSLFRRVSPSPISISDFPDKTAGSCGSMDRKSSG